MSSRITNLLIVARRRVFHAAIALLVLPGCVSLPDDAGRQDVDGLVAARGQTTSEAKLTTLLASLADRPLTATRAVHIALAHNPALRARYADLGLGAADVYAASRIRNPLFSASILDSNRGGERDQVTLGFMTSFTDLLTLRGRKRLASGEFAALKQSVAAAVLETAALAETGYYRFVAEKQLAELRGQVAKAAALSAALAQRYADAGNMTKRELALERAAAAEARLAALAADAQAYSARTAFASVLGISTGALWDVPSTLPVPLDEEDTLDELLVLAHRSRLDLAAAKTHADIAAEDLGISDRTRWLGDFDIGIEQERETDGARLTGPTVDVQLPLFTTRRDIRLRAGAKLGAALAEVARLTVAVDNEVHLAYAATQNARARVTQHRDHLLPARVEATARAQEEENFMLIGTFELLATKKQEYDSYQGYLEAVRDYWLARVALARAVGNTLPSSRNVEDRPPIAIGSPARIGTHGTHREPSPERNSHPHHNGDTP